MNKLGVTNTAHTNHNGIQCFDGVWMAFCSKCQAWSGALNARTTGFHEVALLAASIYCLPSTNPFSRHHSTTPSFNSIGNGTSAPVLNTAASVPQGEVAASNDLIQLSKSKETQVLCNFQTSTPDADISALAGTLGEALGLNLHSSKKFTLYV